MLASDCAPQGFRRFVDKPGPAAPKACTVSKGHATIGGLFKHVNVDCDYSKLARIQFYISPHHVADGGMSMIAILNSTQSSDDKLASTELVVESSKLIHAMHVRRAQSHAHPHCLIVYSGLG